jgi:hypothetical protein
MQPMGFPSRSLKAAIDFLAFVTTGCWPAMVSRSRTALSIAWALVKASPMPMFSTTFSIFGTCMMLP